MAPIAVTNRAPEVAAAPASKPIFKTFSALGFTAPAGSRPDGQTPCAVTLLNLQPREMRHRLRAVLR